ncbi:MAG: penicillin-binding protein 2, partial [Candidatus Doudnabacteria bacterium RIFCSPLOWO2_12_FULL_49_8]
KAAELAKKLDEIALILGQDAGSLAEQISKMIPDSYQEQVLAQNIVKDQALILIAKAGEFPGFVVENNAIRDYKEPLAFTHLTGYTGKITQAELEAHEFDNYALNDNIGKTGLEYQYEAYLRGINGKRQIEIDATGKFKGQLAEVPPVAGSNAELSIDFDLQTAVYQALSQVMKPLNAKRAAAVATNPQTGEVLALVSFPAFDSNMFARGISQAEFSELLNDQNNPMLNRVVAGNYPPGSTIKPMMAIAALTEGVVTPETKILDDGVIRIGSYTFYGYEHSGLGIMDIYSAIARSSDIYFYTVGGGNPNSEVTGLGPERIAQYLRKFHVGEPLGIDLPGEKSGLVPDPAWKQTVKKEPWYLGDTYHESIGQGDVLSTPLQVNSWTATIANGGKIMQPYLLKQASGQDGRVLAEGQPKTLAENIFDPKFVKVVQEGMRQTITAGSARTLAGLPVAISGKTGTAQFDARDLTRTHSWFTSYAPAEQPQIALTIIVEAAGEGHSVALPAAKKVYEWWIANRYNK